MLIGKKKIYFTIFLSMVSVVISMGIKFIITPYITNNASAEAYGFVSLATNFVNYANILMISLNSYAARFITVSYLHNDYKQFNKYFSTVFIADLVVGGLLFVGGLFCVINLELLLNISQKLISDVKLLFLLTFLAFYMTTMSTVYTTVAYVKDRLDFSNIIKAISYIVEALVLIVCFLSFTPFVWYVGLASVAMAITTLIGSFLMTKRLLPTSKVSFNNFSFKAVKELLGNGLWNSANSLGNVLNSGLDLLVSNLMLSGTVMGQVSIAKTLSGIVYQLYETMSQPFQPTFLRYYSNNDKTGLMENFKHSMSVCGMFTNLIFAGFFAIGLEFFSLWIPTQDAQFIYKLTVIAMMPSISEGCIYPAYYTYALTLKNRVPCIITIIGGLINVSAKYFLLKYTSLGAYAVLLTTAIIMNFINLVTNPLYMSKSLGMKKTVFYPTIIRNITSCLIITIILKYVVHLLPTCSSWIVLLFYIIILGIMGVLIQVPILFWEIIVCKVKKRKR